ncbi:unnamed protein product [Brassica rapa]|uniref:Uncharacterized protein n=3 Tax=Brassica TaxID=3705 RepID=A0A8D9M2U7_BRACM|nr:unnamed protein product [Brassica napus]CAG7860436.1 unnamed protein product [Brassica rapa]CAG7895195.1 unnamed protein product [Brassica rapa]
MVNQQFHLFELKAGRSCQYMEPFCRQSVVRRLFGFWKTRNVKKGGELMGFICIFVNRAMQLLDKLVIHGVEPRVIAATNINPKLAGGMHVLD